jgi:1,4-dihydroxy-2-naphthoate polyprenyltransferase
MEGIILTMNTGSEKIFGYQKDELIGKQRVSLFSPGEIVLQNVASWLDIASKKGEYSGKTIFINKEGEKINAKISITPTYTKDKHKTQNGYCGVTEVIDENIDVPISMSTKLIKLLAITRMPFSSASLLPIFLVASYFYSINIESISIINLCLCSLGVLFAHLSTNMFNDYFDNIDGTDIGNFNYFQQVSGGSRAIELGLISIPKTKSIATLLSLIAIVLGTMTLFNTHNSNVFTVVIITILALLLGYFYTAPPIRLVARNGLGELSIFTVFGPLLILGTSFSIYDGDFLTSNYFIDLLLLSVPVGLLTTNILLINEFPDYEGDLKTGKNHLVATFGKKNSRYIYLFNLVIISLVTFYSAIISNPILFLPLLFIIIYGTKITVHIFKNYNKRSLVIANWDTIKLHAGYCILSIMSFILIKFL